MGQIYMNGLLSIAATDSADSCGGLFRARNPLTIRPVKVNIKSSGLAQFRLGSKRL
jgi:hypothetical protein